MSKPMKNTLIQEIKETLNNSRITGHISERHLIQIHQKEDVYDENEYSYLDEWLEIKLKEAYSLGKAEVIEEVAEKTRQLENSKSRGEIDDLQRMIEMEKMFVEILYSLKEKSELQK